MKDKVFRISRNCILIVLIIIFAIGVFTTESNGRSPFMVNALTMKAIGACMLALGIHFLTFNHLWAQASVDSVDKFLKKLPRFIQIWLGINRTYGYQRSMTILGGFIFVLCGALMFVLS